MPAALAAGTLLADQGVQLKEGMVESNMTQWAQHALAVAGEPRESVGNEVISVPIDFDETIDPVLLAGLESFPASDPPSWLGTTAGAPVTLPVGRGGSGEG